MVVPVMEDNGQVMPNRVRILWGRMENFKCVDYFQVEYFQRLNPAGTLQGRKEGEWPDLMLV